MVYPAQEGQKYRMAGPLAASGKDGSGLNIKGGQPRGGVKPDIVRCKALHLSPSKRKLERSAVKGRYRTLLVHTKHQGMIGRVKA